MQKGLDLEATGSQALGSSEKINKKIILFKIRKLIQIFGGNY